MDTQSRSCGGCTATAEQLVSTPDAALRKIMGAVFAINVALFTGETLAGWWADSSALQADALDSLGDAAVYALSFIAVGRSLRWRLAWRYWPRLLVEFLEAPYRMRASWRRRRRLRSSAI